MKLIGLFLLLFLFGGCYYDSEQLLYPGDVTCAGVNASFSKDVLPIVQQRCALGGCHAAGSVNTGGALTNYTEINSKSARIKTSVLNRSMPKGTSLTTAEIQLISCWISSGAPNN